MCVCVCVCVLHVSLPLSQEWEREINEICTDPASIVVENTVDLEGPPQRFKYINKYIPTEGIVIPDDPVIGCECKDCNAVSGVSALYSADRIFTAVTQHSARVGCCRAGSGIVGGHQLSRRCCIFVLSTPLPRTAGEGLVLRSGRRDALRLQDDAAAARPLRNTHLRVQQALQVSVHVSQQGRAARQEGQGQFRVT